MSVICIDQDLKHFTVYMKGSPNKIKEFCKKESLPKHYLEEVREY
jgi:magnesium-transporting ATPase (P-type)